MDACIRTEFGLSDHEYRCLLKTLHARFGVKHIEDLAYLPQTDPLVTDKWEAAAMKRLVEIVVTHVGVEKLHRESAKACLDGGVSLPKVIRARRPSKAAHVCQVLESPDPPIEPTAGDNLV
jgi:hypothetical protein